MKTVRGAGILVVIGAVLAAFLGVFGFGPGGGPGAGPGLVPQANTRPEAEIKPVTPKEMVVRITGSKYYVGEEELTAVEIAERAANRLDAVGNPDPATVRIQRADDATRGAREDLVAELRKRELLYHVD